MAHVRDTLRNKCALPDACLGETTSSRFGVRRGHGCEIDAEGLRQSAMCRQLLPSAQATARDVFGQRLDDAPVNWTLPVTKRRDPFHTLFLPSAFCMLSPT